ncbi:thioredoxin family protein [Aquimarina sp. AU474]|uniref:thioredoxin family protein n=1 Tax=Aquimarina sp. AU474 TaxID=2108529 RepID=UPI000D69F793|nr:thioredoxin family protein [Aquimarina sp. AU474]
MRYPYLFLLLFLSNLVVFSQEQKDSYWLYDFEQAKEISKEEDKPILMYFSGSDWCRPCMMLQEDVFDNYKFQKFKNAFVFLYIDIPRNTDLLSSDQKVQNFKLLSTYNKQKTFPLINIVNHKGKILDDISGYSSLRDTTYHFEMFEKYSR